MIKTKGWGAAEGILKNVQKYCRIPLHCLLCLHCLNSFGAKRLLEKNHENQPKTMKNQPGSIKNHGNQPKTMKNPETTLKKPWKLTKNQEKP